MSNKEADEANELRWAETALALRRITTDGPLERYRENARPDFHFTRRGRRIALEVVRAIDNPVARGRGAVNDIERVLGTLLREASIRVDVKLRLSEGEAAVLHGRADRGRVIEANAHAIVKLAREVAAAQEMVFRRFTTRTPVRPLRRGIDDPRRLPMLGIDLVDTVMIRPHAETNVAVKGSAQPWGAGLIQKVIDDKNRKLATYRKTGDEEYWLLVVGSVGRASNFDVSVTEGVTFESDFDRTLFLELWQEKCVRLTTRSTH